MEVVYEDNHIIIVNKQSGEIVQGDKTGDRPLSDIVKDYIKEKYQKPGAVFLGVVHRLDRPVSGLVVFARTSKALTRLNKMFAEGEVHKTYWAIVQNPPQQPEGLLQHWLVRNEKQNKSYAYDREKPQAKKAMLKYKVIGHSERYWLLEVNSSTILVTVSLLVVGRITIRSAPMLLTWSATRLLILPIRERMRIILATPIAIPRQVRKERPRFWRKEFFAN